MSDAHLKVPIDALFFTRLSGELCSQAGKARVEGDIQGWRVLQGISDAILNTLTDLGEELREPKEGRLTNE